MKNRFLVLDTETISPVSNRNIKYAYQLAYLICDKHGKVYTSRSVYFPEVVAIYDRSPDLYLFGDVIGHNIADAEPVYFRDEMYRLAEYAAQCKYWAAYNIAFDKNALEQTARFYRMKGEIKSPFIDIYGLACKYLLSRPAYCMLANEQAWISKAGNPRANLECAFRYVSGKYDIVQSHEAMDDVNKAKDVLVYIFRQKKSILPYVGKIEHQPWRQVSKACR